MFSNVLKIALLGILISVAYKFFFAVNTAKGSYVGKDDMKTSEASLLIKKHAELYGSPQVIKVTDHVYVAVGFALANMIMIEGTDGVIIVDTTESHKSSLKIWKEFQKITKKPLKAVIITHFHADHILGAASLIDANRISNEKIEIFMHSTTAFELKRFKTSFDVGFRRAGRQFGIMLDRDAEHLDSGIGPSLNFGPDSDYRIVNATQTFDKQATFNVAGVKFTLIHTPGETDDQINIWIPEWKVVLTADNIYEAFPNLYAIRGSPPRECAVWYKSLDKVRRLGAHYMVPSHGTPLAGEQEIYDTITHYRDAIQFIHDQTIRWMNKGLDIDEIVEKVHLPPTLALHPYLQEFYGRVSWSVRSVFSGQLGWFGGDPVYLNPLSKQKRALKMIEFLNKDYGTKTSGHDKLLSEAKYNIEQSVRNFNTTGRVLVDELQWGLELTSHALKAADAGSALHTEAKDLTVQCLKLLATSTINSNARNYYLTCAKELETGLDIVIGKEGKQNAIEGSKMEDIMSQLQYRLVAESCDDLIGITVVFEFSDLGQSYAYILRHCVLEYVDNNPELIPEKFDAKLIISSSVWKDIVSKKRSAIAAYASGDITMQGSMMTFKQFMDMLDRE